MRHCCTAHWRSLPSLSTRFARNCDSSGGRIATCAAHRRARPDCVPLQHPRVFFSEDPCSQTASGQGYCRCRHRRPRLSPPGRPWPPLPLDDSALGPRADGSVAVGRCEVRSCCSRRGIAAFVASLIWLPETTWIAGGSAVTLCLECTHQTPTASPLRSACFGPPQGVCRLLRTWLVVAPPDAASCGGAAGANPILCDGQHGPGARQLLPHAGDAWCAPVIRHTCGGKSRDGRGKLTSGGQRLR